MIGGAVGSAGRYAVGKLTLGTLGPNYPWGTLAVNLIGGFLMGLLAGMLARTGGSEHGRLLIGVGVLGGFTTFSAFSLDAATDDRARAMGRRGRLCAGLGDRIGARAVRRAVSGQGGGMSEIRTFTVAPDDDGIRLDRWFKRHLPDTSFTTVAKWARTGQLRVDGARAKPGDRIALGPDAARPAGRARAAGRQAQARAPAASATTRSPSRARW